MFSHFLTNVSISHIAPANALSSAGLMGGFGKRLFEQSEFPLATH
jgi:hypothetical protein